MAPRNNTVAEDRKIAQGLVDFVNASPSPFHTVDTAKGMLKEAGFVQLCEKSSWGASLKKGGKYFVVRDESALLAFIVGGKYLPGNGFSLVGGHTDSPCLKLKPVSKQNHYGYLQVGVQCYGGGIWRTWLDRDLKLAGRVIIKNKLGELESRLINIDRPIMRLPNLCIHLSTPDDDVLNKETQMTPILATKVFEDRVKKELEGLNKLAINDDDDNDDDNNDDVEQEVEVEVEEVGKPEYQKHHTVLVNLICETIGGDVQPKDLIDVELSLADHQKATLGGIYNEFVFGPRLDNQFGSYCAVKGIIDSAKEEAENETNIRMINIFDCEECGSGSAQGAQSKLTELVMRRISDHFGAGYFEQAIANSFLLSADQGHAIHPNYPEKHEENHQVTLHKGPLLKINCNQRYSTTALTGGIIQEVGRACGVPLQDYVVRNDSHCGTTIGPIQAARLGMRTVDVGGPELSMHSIRETCCVTSVGQMINLFKKFFQLFPKIDAGMKKHHVTTPQVTMTTDGDKDVANDNGWIRR